MQIMVEQAAGDPTGEHETRHFVRNRLVKGLPFPLPSELKSFYTTSWGEPPEDAISGILKNMPLSPKRTVIVNELETIFTEEIASPTTEDLDGKKRHPILRSFSRIIDLSRPEELRDIIVTTFDNYLEKPEEEVDEGFIFNLAMSALPYARKDNAKDLEIWKKRGDKWPILNGVVLQALLVIEPNDPIVTAALKRALLSEKDWATRWVTRDVATARGAKSVSATIKELVLEEFIQGNPPLEAHLREVLSVDPELAKLI